MKEAHIWRGGSSPLHVDFLNTLKDIPAPMFPRAYISGDDVNIIGVPRNCGRSFYSTQACDPMPGVIFFQRAEEIKDGRCAPPAGLCGSPVSFPPPFSHLLVAMAEERGLLIVFEGLDKTGKTTQSRLLQHYLESRGRPAALLAFPERSTPIGGLIDEFLKKRVPLDDHAIHLLFSANRWELAGRMKTLLRDGYFVIVDRYFFSGIAYTMAKNTCDEIWCQWPDVGLPRPDVIFYLDCEIEESVKRTGFGEEIYETATLQGLVKKAYHDMISTQVHFNWHVVPAGLSVPEVQEKICRFLESILDARDGQEAGRK